MIFRSAFPAFLFSLGDLEDFVLGLWGLVARVFDGKARSFVIWYYFMWSFLVRYLLNVVYFVIGPVIVACVVMLAGRLVKGFGVAEEWVHVGLFLARFIGEVVGILLLYGVYLHRDWKAVSTGGRSGGWGGS